MSEIRRANAVFQQQADAVLSQANPVSTTLYTVLVTTKNVRIIGIEAHLTWATTQPTPLEVVVTIDGVTVIYKQADPVSATFYYAINELGAAENAQTFNTANVEAVRKAFLLEGRSVKVEERITWATTQPTPLVCRMKHTKIP